MLLRLVFYLVKKNVYNKIIKLCFFYGQTGAGKSHLCSAIVSNWNEMYPNAKDKLTKMVLVYGAFQDIYREMVNNVKAKHKDIKLKAFDDLDANLAEITSPQSYKDEKHSLLILG